MRWLHAAYAHRTHTAKVWNSRTAASMSGLVGARDMARHQAKPYVRAHTHQEGQRDAAVETPLVMGEERRPARVRPNPEVVDCALTTLTTLLVLLQT